MTHSYAKQASIQICVVSDGEHISATLFYGSCLTAFEAYIGSRSAASAVKKHECCVQKYMGHIYCKHNSYTRRCVTDILVSTSSQYMTALVESGTGEEARRQFQTRHWLI